MKSSHVLACQKHLFDLPDDVVYLNGAYMSPSLRAVSEAGIAAIQKKARPFNITIEDFFEPLEELKAAFAQLVNVPEAQRIAIIPSVSYGMANAARNIHIQPGQTILLMEEQFPSNYYIWERVAAEKGAQLKIISSPEHAHQRAVEWTARVCEAITPQTAVVAMAHVHWADGTVFGLQEIGTRARACGAALIIDGTQSVGALPFDVQAIQPDALICAGYKWLLGPYSIGLAYYGPMFDDGVPVEENWINRQESHIFQKLAQYQLEYRPLAARYSVGEQSNFILSAMMLAALRQILAWEVDTIQAYCQRISSAAVEGLQALGVTLDQSPARAAHLFGGRLGPHFHLERLREELLARRVHVSFRGDAIRIAPHVYNTEDDFEVLIDCLRQAIQ